MGITIQSVTCETISKHCIFSDVVLLSIRFPGEPHRDLFPMSVVQECSYRKLCPEFQINTPELFCYETTDPLFTSSCYAVEMCSSFRLRDMYGILVGVQRSILVPVCGCSELMVSFYFSLRANCGNSNNSVALNNGQGFNWSCMPGSLNWIPWSTLDWVLKLT